MKTVFEKLLALVVLFGTFFTHICPKAETSIQNGFSDGSFIQQTESQKSTNGFAGKLDLTEDPQFLDNWQKRWHSASTFKHGDEFYIVLFVSDDMAIQIDSFYDLTVSKPDGSVYYNRTNVIALKHSIFPATGPSSRHLKPCPKFVGIHIDPEDPSGVYRVNVILKDKVTKSELNLEKTFTVEK